jgi:anti-sigma B factor antagonist
MKRHRTASAVSIGTQSASAATEGAASRALTAFTDKTPAQPAPSEPSPVLASVSARTHTLVLTGELDHHSAPALEAEIERLCKEGVTGITLDLRELTYIDSIGVAVIAFRYRLCKRRGYELAVIPGSRFMHRAFEQAGVEDLLPFQREDVA